MIVGDTIAAISSAVGPAARLIVRLSGHQAKEFASNVSEGALPEGAFTRRSRVKLDAFSFPTWIYCFASPHSVTGEDVIEFHIPGNPLLARMLLDTLISNGARQADPGEFTARGYFNNRIDLAEAEGVSATISAQSQRELDAARRLLGGELARRLNPLMDALAQTLALIEVGIDFSEEEVVALSEEQTTERIKAVDVGLMNLLDQSTRFESLTHEPVIALVGRPNAGKSTLLNALAGHDRAVVSPVAGTTRDILSAEIILARGAVRLLDAAGFDDDESADTIAVQMRTASLRAVETADLVVLLQDPSDPRPPIALSREPNLIVRTKADLYGGDGFAISAPTGLGMSDLRDRLDELAFGKLDIGTSLALNSRHRHAIEDARNALSRAAGAPELVALELRDALDSLGSILGTITPDDLLGRIFSAFCIGK